MFDENKNYWLWIAPHVYCRIEDTSSILYNTQNGAVLKTQNIDAIGLLRSLHYKTNLGAIYFEGMNLTNVRIKEFVTEYCAKGMGGLVDIDIERQKPIQMMPILNLQQDIDRRQQHDSLIESKNTLNYLLELNVYINNECGKECVLCQNYYKQKLCCTKFCGDDSIELDMGTINRILHQIKYSPVSKINIMGGDVSKYSHYHELLECLSKFDDRVHLWNHYSTFNSQEAPSFLHCDVIVTFPIDDRVFNSCIDALASTLISKYHFYIISVDEYELAESLIEKYGINTFDFHPIYTRHNFDFFEQNIFVTEEEITNGIIPFRRIFANQKLNSNYFGILTILPTGVVYANVNSSPLGNITNQPIYEIIHKELSENTAWRKTRESSPCTDCLYQYLCPPPSNYEIVLKRQNLCHVNFKED